MDRIRIKGGKQLLGVPRNVLLPVILVFCVVGSYAMTNSVYGVIMMVVMGLIGWLMLQKGLKDLKRTDPTPRRTVDTIKDDIQWAKEQRP